MVVAVSQCEDCCSREPLEPCSVDFGARSMELVVCKAFHEARRYGGVTVESDQLIAAEKRPMVRRAMVFGGIATIALLVVLAQRLLVGSAPDQAIRSYNRGVEALESKDYDFAVTCFAEASRLDPGQAEAYRYWSVALLELGRYAKACEKAAKAVEINPQCAKTYWVWGVALALTGERAEAEKKLAKVVELDPELKAQIEEVRKQLQLLRKE